MITKFKELIKNKEFMIFFKRSVLFIGILFIEILLLTLSIDFTGVALGNIFISTDAHLTIYVFILLFLVISLDRLKEIIYLKKLVLQRFILFFTINLLLVFAFYKLNRYCIENSSIAAQSTVFYSFSWWILALMIPISLLFAFFDYAFIILFSKKFKKELVVSAILSVIFLILLKYSLKLWIFFSKIVAKCVYFMLTFFFKGATYHLEDTIPLIGIPAIKAKIYAPCSGIEGMWLFVLLFTVLVLTQYKNVNKKKVLFLYLIGIIGAFLLNILRTFCIFVIGSFTSREFALGIFHSNVGWILFTLYFLIFTQLTYRWMLIK